MRAIRRAAARRRPLNWAAPIQPTPAALPNALASDPPLQQVVSGHLGSRPARQAGDFVHSQSELECRRVPGGKPQRYPLRLLGSVRHRLLPELCQDAPGGIRCQSRWTHRTASRGVSITRFWMATYQSPAVVDGSANNTSDTALSGYPGLDGNIYIHPGNRIPLIPKTDREGFRRLSSHRETRVRSERSGHLEFLRARQ